MLHFHHTLWFWQKVKVYMGQKVQNQICWTEKVKNFYNDLPKWRNPFPHTFKNFPFYYQSINIPTKVKLLLSKWVQLRQVIGDCCPSVDGLVVFCWKFETQPQWVNQNILSLLLGQRMKSRVIQSSTHTRLYETIKNIQSPRRSFRVRAFVRGGIRSVSTICPWKME
jgi:hypothetical protein